MSQTMTYSEYYANPYYGYYYTSTDGVTKAQQWDYAMNAFETYDYYKVKFSHINLKTYLDFYGKIEEKYKCSGICEIYEVYFFSDITDGLPKNSCFESIRDNIIMEQIYTIGFIILLIGIFMLSLSLYLFIQWRTNAKSHSERESTEQEELQPGKEKQNEKESSFDQKEQLEVSKSPSDNQIHNDEIWVQEEVKAE